MKLVLKNGKIVSDINNIEAAITQDVIAVEKVIAKDALGTAEIGVTTFVSALAVSAPTLASDTSWADLKVAGAALLVSAATAALAAVIKYVKSVLPKGNTPNA